ncbi:hypothetical protein OIU78_022384 [Salix suchowensis]|nr:hypothetical protein OIU78_022384 [Salix suchowensis]
MSGHVDAAIKSYRKALLLRPDFPEATCNLLHTLQLPCPGQYWLYSVCIEDVIDLCRTFSVHSSMFGVDSDEFTVKYAAPLPPPLSFHDYCVCCWEDRDKMFNEVEGIIQRQVSISVLPSVQPFHAIAYPIDPVLALEISRKYAAHCSVIASRFALSPFKYPAPLPVKHERQSGRLRIGYVSSDFGNHPFSHLMGSVFDACYDLTRCAGFLLRFKSK